MISNILRRKKIYIELKDFLKPFKMLIFKLFVFKNLLLIPMLITPYLFKMLIDDVMVDKDISFFKWIVLGYIGVYIAQTALIVNTTRLTNNLLNKVTFQLKLRMFKRYLVMPVSNHSNYGAGDLKNRIDNDVQAFESFLSGQMIGYACAVFQMMMNGIMMIYLNWKLAVIGCAMLPVSFWITKKIGAHMEKSSEISRQISGDYQNWIQNVLEGWREFKVLSMEKALKDKFTDFWNNICKELFKIMMVWCINTNFIGLKDRFINKIGLSFAGVLFIIKGETTIGSMLVFMVCFEAFVAGTNTINSFDIELRQSHASLKRVLEIMVPTPLQPKALQSVPMKTDIEFCNVSFDYTQGKEEILSDINLKIEKYEHIAVVGKSGSGKTTLIKLVLGLIKPRAGRILIGGHDICEMNPVDLHRHVGVVMQDSILFNMSIKENFLLTKPAASDKEIMEACKMAQIHEFIRKLPDGYQTVIGEKGVKLSGGQRQFLAVARVILSNPDIVIFDEATSAMDSHVESQINKAIRYISKDKTVITIAHRLSSLQAADRLIILDEGKIAAVGKHSELRGNNALYDEMFESQFQEMQVG